MPRRRKIQAETDLGENEPKTTPVKKVTTTNPKVEKEYGIKELSDVVLLVCSFVFALSRAEHKGRTFWKDAIKYIGTVKRIPDAVKGFSEIPNEIKDLDAEEIKALHKLIEDNFNLANKDKEKQIERMLTASFTVIEAVNSIFR